MRSFMRYLCLSTLMASLLLTAVSPSRASDTVQDRETLRGLLGVEVLVEDLDDETKRAGFDVNTIQTDVELKLRLAGVKVLTKEESIKTPGSPYLYVNLNFIPANGFSVYQIEVDLKQSVLLDRDNAVRSYGATTWSTSILGMAPRDTVSTIRRALSDLLDKFLNAYLAVNPKK
jgi:hypothetical protein